MNKLTKVEWNVKKEPAYSLNFDIPIVELNLEVEQNSKKERKDVVFSFKKLVILSEELKKMKKAIQSINNEL